MTPRTQRLLFALWALELLACLGDLLLGPFARVHWEERFNARAGVQLACGHWDALSDLQYVSFCGGCTGEAVLAVPLFQTLGPTVLAWKLVPLFFHGVVLAAGSALLARAAGRRAAVAFVALLAAAPGFYRELVLTGWGNHVESAAFGLSAAWLLVRASDTDPLRRAGLVALAGAVTGLGLWFCHTSAYALLALLLGVLWVAPAATPLFLAGAWMGVAPYRWYFAAEPDQLARTTRWATNLTVAPGSRFLDWLGGPYLRWGLWDPADHGEGGPARGAWWFGLWAAGLGGLVPALGAVARRVPRGWSQARRTRGTHLAQAYGSLGLIALLGSYAVRYDLWAHLPEVPSQPTLGLRYRAPLVVLLGAGAALWAGRSRAALLLVVPLVAFGLGMRMQLWTALHTEVVGLGVYAHDGWPDRTVPLGAPRQRRAKSQGRPQDIAAGLAFVSTHEDPWPECAGDHLFEVGRRVGLGISARGAGAADWRSLDALIDTPHHQRLLADGVVGAGVSPEGEGIPELLAWLPQAPASWQASLAEAAGRRIAAQVPRADHPGLQRGICMDTGDRWLAQLRKEAGRRAALHARLEPPPPCTDGFAQGAGWALAREVGCGASAGQQAQRWGTEALDGFAAGCKALRR